MRYVAVLLLCVFAAGCGRESDNEVETLAAPTGDGPVAAYTEWLGALEAQDAGAACARHAPDFTIELRYEAVLLDRAELGDPCVGFVAVLWEQADRELDPLGVEVTQETDEDALLAVDFPAVDQTVTMEKRNASWFVLDTSPRGRDGGDPDRWLDAWCDLATGMTVAEVSDRMGQPSGTYTIANGGEPQLYWTQDQYDFRAYLDADPPVGSVLDLVGDYDRLSGPDRALLPCPELR